jgi:hypothetical protein
MFALYRKIWSDFLKLPVDDMPWDEFRIRSTLKQRAINGEWYEIYELIEFMLNDAEHGDGEELAKIVAKVLAEEVTGFSLVSKRFIEISDEREIAAIEQAIHASVDESTPVRYHLEAAVRLFADKRAPDYRNSVKESISAVEATVQIITGDPKAELGKALSMVASKAPLHGAFASALKSLYGYTSDAEGIRHALSDEPSLDAADARFMLASCAAFVMYLRQKAGK